MTSESGGNSGGAAWFVGAGVGGNDDRVPRFLSEGIWENGYQDRYLEMVKAMRPGDRIAIKASYTRKHGLPFDNRGHTVSVMSIKAIGTVTENPGDGRIVRVAWTPVDPIREWYFYTNQLTIWRVLPGDWTTDGLIAFTFDGRPQDIDRFCNAPYWRERFGTSVTPDRHFTWIPFYEAVASKLLAYRHDRKTLVDKLQNLAATMPTIGYLASDQFTDGTKGFVRDICPFTTFGLFNRNITLANRRQIAGALATFLGVEEPVPENFDSVPLLNNMKSWFFPFAKDREEGHIDSLWNVFAKGIEFADAPSDDTRGEFALSFDAINGAPRVAWNLTMGLYWMRPMAYPSLDGNSREYITRLLMVPLAGTGPKKLCTAAEYLGLRETLDSRFREDGYPVHSFPELSYKAWSLNGAEAGDPTGSGGTDDDGLDDQPPGPMPPPITPYSIDDILRDGSFLDRATLASILERLRTKKNVVLQGPPGTGKTWLAKRLAFALIGEKNESKVRAVQFHPNLSYEDFVRGWRPTGDGKLALTDGVFMQAVKAAAAMPGSNFVVVIEEINRGNPAQIFGELLTLLEAGKRTPDCALELCYPDPDGHHRLVHVPENLHVIGTMNIADRSLALVDLALRRRFAFIGLEPALGKPWTAWVTGQCNLEPSLAAEIESRIGKLNTRIEADSRLGKQFRIGHSYVTPSYKLEGGHTAAWFRQVVETEIGPLLEEYWFDAPGEAAKATAELLQGWP
jgi:5-methylcytosine-specific restriction enzyme B